MGRIAIRLFYLGVALVVLACLGVILPLELVYYLLAGWYLYLARVLPEVQISWSMIGLGLACMTFANSVDPPPRQWPFKRIPAAVARFEGTDGSRVQNPAIGSLNAL